MPSDSIVTISTLTSDNEGRYQNFVSSRPGLNIYYSLNYRTLLAGTLDCQLPYFLAESDGEVVGILPLAVQSGVFGPIGNSLPFFGSYGGVVADQPDVAAMLWRALGRQVESGELAACTVIDNPLAPTPCPWSGTIRDDRIGHVSTLVDGDDIAGSARRNLRKAHEAGITIRADNSVDALLFLARAHRAGMATIGGLSKPEAFFVSLPLALVPNQDFVVYVAEYQGERIAALLMMYYNHVADYFIPATAPGARSLQPMAPLIAYAMSEARDRGCTVWNWGGTWPSQQGVARFKRKWGGVDRHYAYHTLVGNKALLTAEPETLREAYPNFFVIPFTAISRQ